MKRRPANLDRVINMRAKRLGKTPDEVKQEFAAPTRVFRLVYAPEDDEAAVLAMNGKFHIILTAELALDHLEPVRDVANSLAEVFGVQVEVLEVPTDKIGVDWNFDDGIKWLKNHLENK